MENGNVPGGMRAEFCDHSGTIRPVPWIIPRLRATNSMHGDSDRVRYEVTTTRPKTSTEARLRDEGTTRRPWLLRIAQVHGFDIYICLTTLPFISGLSTSHSSLNTANSESETITERPRLHTSVMA